jgi:protease IV
MKKFIVGFFALVGFFMVTLIVLAITITSIRGDKKKHEMPSRMVLTLDLSNGLPEANGQEGILDTFSEPTPSLQDVVQTLELARQDSRITGIAVHVGQGSFGVGVIQELRDAILRFRRSGKFAYVYSDTLGNSPAMGEYWLATAFDQIWLQPLGELAITGFNIEMPFAKDFLDKVGVQPELLHEGRYKSFPETVMRNSISDDNKEMTLSLLTSLQAQFDKDIQATRHLTSEQVRVLMDNAPIIAPDALAAGLIDSIGYHDEFDSYLEQTTNGAEAVDLESYQANGPRAVPGEKIALINVLGALTNVAKEEARSGEVVSADDISNAIEDAGNQSSIKAIIVRVDSPGGTPLAADMIRRSIELARIRKPVIVSMGNTAASGSYWMSVNANTIVAQPGTLTGSIGVFGGKVNLEKLWQKLGITWNTVGANPDQNLWSINKPFDPKSREKIAKSMNRTYEQFIARVSEGRKLSHDQVQAIAQGRVWTGAQAVQNGLVDALGGLDVAVTKAKDQARIPVNRPVNLEVFPKPMNPLEQLFKMIKQGVPFQLMGTWFSNNLTQTLSQKMLIAAPTIR